MSADPRRDGYGRYLLPDLTTGRERSWTRATTRAKALSDQTALSAWKARTVAEGMMRRPDLAERITEINNLVTDERERKREIDAVCEDALGAAGGRDASTAGTDLHELTELVDRHGLGNVEIPARFERDVYAYVETMNAAAVVRPAEWIERIVINTTVDVAGTFDRVIRLPDGTLSIFDLKTGRDLRYAWLDIAVQLSIYANADAMWNAETEEYEPMPAVDRFVGYVGHLPVGRGEMTLWRVDIAAGWNAAKLAHAVAGWRARRDLAAPVTPAALVTSAVIHREIAAAETPADLAAVWGTHAPYGAWTERHTEAARDAKESMIRKGVTDVRMG